MFLTLSASMPDEFVGRRVYFPHALADRPPREFGLILNWTALLK